MCIVFLSGKGKGRDSSQEIGDNDYSGTRCVPSQVKARLPELLHRTVG